MKKIFTLLFLGISFMIYSQDYPTTSYRLRVNTDGSSCLLEWLGTEPTVNMRQDNRIKYTDSIAINAFNRKRTQRVFVGDYVSDIHHRAFFYAQQLYAIIAADQSKYFKTIDGVLYTKDGKTLHTYPYAKSTEVDNLPDSITTIAMTAFRNITPLTSVVLPESVITIEEASFANNSNLRKVELGSNLDSIKGSFFSSVAIEELISKNPYPPGLKGNAFGHPTDATINENFYNKCILYVPVGSKELYADPEIGGDWSKFKNIQERVFASVQAVKKQDSIFKFYTTNNTLSIKNLTFDNHSLWIYSISGEMVHNQNINSQATLNFNLSQGIYIVKMADQVNKIIVN